MNVKKNYRTGWFSDDGDVAFRSRHQTPQKRIVIQSEHAHIHTLNTSIVHNLCLQWVIRDEGTRKKYNR